MKQLATIASLALSLVPGLAAAQAKNPGEGKQVAAAEPTAAAPPPRAVVVHVAPITTEPGEPIPLEAMIDAPFSEKLSVRWRPIGEAKWQDIEFERSSAGGWFASIPAADVRGVEYYIRGTDAAGVEIDHFASASSPHVVRVDPSLFDRLEALDIDRLRNRRNEITLDVVAHNFGNRYDLRDRFIRTELNYAYRLLRQLHEISFGFGSITGRTPTTEEPTAMDVLKGMRYGFGKVRLRAHPSVFIDARLGLGVTHEDFEGQGAAAITFGKPWRSCIQIGGEMIGDLGPSAWVRLQWDTAPPLLMGASIVRTDLPGVQIDVAGLYIAYDVQYQVADRFSMKAQLSYGARDGAAHVGGGLGTAVAF